MGRFLPVHSSEGYKIERSRSLRFSFEMTGESYTAFLDEVSKAAAPLSARFIGLARVGVEHPY